MYWYFDHRSSSEWQLPKRTKSTSCDCKSISRGFIYFPAPFFSLLLVIGTPIQNIVQYDLNSWHGITRCKERNKWNTGKTAALCTCTCKCTLHDWPRWNVRVQLGLMLSDQNRLSYFAVWVVACPVENLYFKWLKCGTRLGMRCPEMVSHRGVFFSACHITNMFIVPQPQRAFCLSNVFHFLIHCITDIALELINQILLSALSCKPSLA